MIVQAQNIICKSLEDRWWVNYKTFMEDDESAKVLMQVSGGKVHSDLKFFKNVSTLEEILESVNFPLRGLCIICVLTNFRIRLGKSQPTRLTVVKITGPTYDICGASSPSISSTSRQD